MSHFEQYSNAVESFNNEEEDTLIDETANMTNEPENDSCNLTISKKRPNDVIFLKYFDQKFDIKYLTISIKYCKVFPYVTY